MLWMKMLPVLTDLLFVQLQLPGVLGLGRSIIWARGRFPGGLEHLVGHHRENQYTCNNIKFQKKAQGS